MRSRENGRLDQGFTMIELLVSLSILGVMTALAVSGWSGYARSNEHSGTRSDIVSALRAANMRALAEAKPYCVTFDVAAATWSTRRLSCAGVVVKGPEQVEGPQIALAGAGFLQPDGTTQPQVLFTPRGTGSKGSLKVTRSGSSKVYVVSVEGLTGRVSSN